MLYILAGLPYSGKTTLTKELVNRFGFSSVSMDDIIDERGYKVEKMTQGDWNSVYSEGYEKLKRLLLMDKTVVLDLGNLKRKERTTAKEIAKSLESGYKLIYINISVNEIKRRWAVNDKTKEREQLKQITLDRALNMFEEPTTDENYITYNQGMNLGKWVEKNISSF